MKQGPGDSTFVMPTTPPLSLTAMRTLVEHLAHGVSVAPEYGTLTLVILPQFGQTISWVCISSTLGAQRMSTMILQMFPAVVAPVIHAVV